MAGLRRNPRVAAAMILMAMSSRTATAAAPTSTLGSAFVNTPLKWMQQARQAHSRAVANVAVKATHSLARGEAGSMAAQSSSFRANHHGLLGGGSWWRFSGSRPTAGSPGLQLRMCASSATPVGAELPEVIDADLIDVQGNMATLKVSIDGQGTTLQGVHVKFACGTGGTVIWQRTPLLFVLLDEEPAGELGKTAVVCAKDNVTVPVGLDLVGRSVDHMCRPIDGGAPLSRETTLPMFGAPTLQANMATISKPLHTGEDTRVALLPPPLGLLPSPPVGGTLNESVVTHTTE